jgi:hypothetical protein
LLSILIVDGRKGFAGETEAVLWMKGNAGMEEYLGGTGHKRAGNVKDVHRHEEI